MAPRKHAARCLHMYLVPVNTCRLLVAMSIVCPAATGLLLPFGTSQSDARSQMDTGSTPAVSLPTPFVFFGDQHSTLHAINDGFVSFTSTDTTIYDVQDDFTAIDIAVVCVFCSDIVPGTSGSVWSRLTNNTAALQTIQNVAREYQEFGAAFTPSWAFVVTWDNVLTYQPYTGPGNTMQAILASDGTTSLVILQYDVISWIDDSSIRAKVGFNKGDRTHFYLLPESTTTALFNLTATSNTGTPGRYLFRVDKASVSPTLTKTTTTVPATAPATTAAATAPFTTAAATTLATTATATAPATTAAANSPVTTGTDQSTRCGSSSIETSVYIVMGALGGAVLLLI